MRTANREGRKLWEALHNLRQGLELGICEVLFKHPRCLACVLLSYLEAW